LHAWQYTIGPAKPTAATFFRARARCTSGFMSSGTGFIELTRWAAIEEHVARGCGPDQRSPFIVRAAEVIG
jgi:hypothetical protein